MLPHFLGDTLKLGGPLRGARNLKVMRLAIHEQLDLQVRWLAGVTAKRQRNLSTVLVNRQRAEVSQ
jgi:hypothetical protein